MNLIPILTTILIIEEGALALFGRASAVPIAAVGPDHLSALLEVTRKLIQLGIAAL